jgi:hypothetical protein
MKISHPKFKIGDRVKIGATQGGIDEGRAYSEGYVSSAGKKDPYYRSMFGESADQYRYGVLLDHNDFGEPQYYYESSLKKIRVVPRSWPTTSQARLLRTVLKERRSSTPSAADEALKERIDRLLGRE